MLRALTARVFKQGMLAPLSPLYTCTQASRLEIAADHTVWLMEYQAFRAEPVTGWTVFSSEGDWLGEVELPPAFTVREFGEHDVLGVWRDKLGVEFVRRYSIQQ